MKTLKYIALSLLVAASTTACKDDPELLTTDVGPEMTVVSADASGVYGGKVDFEVTMTDRYALSTLKAQVFFDDEMVAEEVIPSTRTFPTARPRCALWGRTCASERRPSTGRSPYRVPSPPT